MIDQRRTLKTMTLGDILDYSIEVYKRNFKSVSILALIFYVPFIVGYNVITAYLYKDFMSTVEFMTVENVENLVYSILAYYVSLGVLGILFAIYSVTIKPVMDAAIIYLVYSDVTYRKTTSLKNIIRSSFKKMPSLMGHKILYGLIILGISIAAVFIIYIMLFILLVAFFTSYSSTGGNEEISTVAIVIITIIFVAFLAGIGFAAAYITVRYMFGIHSLATENQTITGSFSRSSRLVSKNFWHIAMTYLMGTVLFLGIPQILSIAAYFLIYINRNFYIGVSAILQLLNSMIYPFIITLTTMIFINLKIKKEGLDLEVKVDMLLEGQEDYGRDIERTDR